MDAEDLRVVPCPVCENPVLDYAPGVSSAIVDGQLYHPSCAPSITAPELMRVREIVPEPNVFLPDTDTPRRWFDVFDGTGQWSLVLSGGLFIACALYCDRHELVDACECTARVRLSGLLQRGSAIGERMTFHLEVIDVLTRGIDATRAERRPIMDEEELDEMVDAYMEGVSARDFAISLCNRDVSSWEQASDPYPQREFPTAAND